MCYVGKERLAVFSIFFDVFNNLVSIGSGGVVVLG